MQSTVHVQRVKGWPLFRGSFIAPNAAPSKPCLGTIKPRRGGGGPSSPGRPPCLQRLPIPVLARSTSHQIAQRTLTMNCSLNSPNPWLICGPVPTVQRGEDMGVFLAVGYWWTSGLGWLARGRKVPYYLIFSLLNNAAFLLGLCQLHVAYSTHGSPSFHARYILKVHEIWSAPL